MIVQPGFCRTWLETQIVVFAHAQAQISVKTLFQSKQLDLHFTIGEALVFAAQGPTSPVARDLWTETEQEFKVNFHLFFLFVYFPIHEDNFYAPVFHKLRLKKVEWITLVSVTRLFQSDLGLQGGQMSLHPHCSQFCD